MNTLAHRLALLAMLTPLAPLIVAHNRRLNETRLATALTRRYQAHRINQTGQGLAEYALILALVAIIAIVALVFLGNQVTTALSTVGGAFESLAPVTP